MLKHTHTHTPHHNEASSVSGCTYWHRALQRPIGRSKVELSVTEVDYSRYHSRVRGEVQTVREGGWLWSLKVVAMAVFTGKVFFAQTKLLVKAV